MTLQLIGVALVLAGLAWMVGGPGAALCAGGVALAMLPEALDRAERRTKT